MPFPDLVGKIKGPLQLLLCFIRQADHQRVKRFDAPFRNHFNPPVDHSFILTFSDVSQNLVIRGLYTEKEVYAPALFKFLQEIPVKGIYPHIRYPHEFKLPEKIQDVHHDIFSACKKGIVIKGHLIDPQFFQFQQL